MALSDLNIRLILNDKQFRSGLSRAQKSMAKFGKQMSSVGKNLTMSLTAPIGLMAVTSLKAFDTQAQALAKLNAQILANGKDVEATSKDYQEFATSLQEVTTVGDEATLRLLQMAETMKSSDPKAAAQGAIGLSKALGVNLESAIKMATLAMEGDFNMLQRYVPALKTASSEAEKAAIVQKLFADGLEIAKAEALSGLGPLKQLKNSWGDFQEQIGGIISRMLPPLVEKLKTVVKWLQSMSPEAQEMAVKIALIAAAVGPLLFIFGKLIMVGAKLAGVIRLISAAMAANPIGAIIVVIGLLVGAIVFLINKVGGISNAWELMKVAAIATVKTVIEYFKTLGRVVFQIGKNIAASLMAPFKALTQALDKDFAGAAETLKDALTSPFKGVGDIVTEAADTVKIYWGEVSKLRSEQKLQTKAAEDATKAQKELNKVTKEAAPIAGDASGGKGTGKRKQIPIFFAPIKEADLSNMIDNSQSVLDTDATELVITPNINMDAAVKQAQDFASEMVRVITDALNQGFELLGETIGDMISGGSFSDVMNGMIGIITNFMKTLGKMFIAIGVAQAGIQAAMSTLNPVLAIGAGVALITAAAVANNFMSKGFATGTASAMPGLRMVGEHGPELVNFQGGESVLNANRTKGMMGGEGQTLTTVIKGRDLLVTLERAQAQNNRV